MTRVLWCVVGVGAGNTTRTLAILAELRAMAPGLDIQFAAQGKALELLRERGETVHALQTVTYASSGAMTGWRIVANNLSFPKKFAANRARAAQLIRDLRPQLVIADSDFYCLGPARAAGVPIVTINSSPVTIALIRKYGIPPGGFFSGRVIEPIDSWLQHHYAHRVIAPTLRPLRGLDPRVHQVPPIVRADYVPNDDPGEEVVVVTGGSGIGAQELDLRGIKAPLRIFGTRIERTPPHTIFEGFNLDDKIMARARVLVIQGGFSSVSEAAAMRRPTVIVPIAGHSEQYVNAVEMERLGLGVRATGAEVSRVVNAVLADREAHAARARAVKLPVDGARRAARELVRLLADGQ